MNRTNISHTPTVKAGRGERRTTAAAQTLIVKNTPEDKQGFALGTLSTAIWGGTMLGNVIGGIVVHYYGYKFTFIACGIMYFIAGIFVLFAKDDFKPEKSTASPYVEKIRKESARQSASMRL